MNILMPSIPQMGVSLYQTVKESPKLIKVIILTEATIGFSVLYKTASIIKALSTLAFVNITFIAGIVGLLVINFLANKIVIGRKINQIPANRQETVCTNALRIIDPSHLSSFKIGLIIQKLGLVPASRLVDATTHALRLFHSPGAYLSDEYFDRVNLVERFAQIPEAQLEIVSSNALRLVTLYMDDYARGLLIEQLARIPSEQLENATTQALRLITPQMHCSDRARLVECIAQIPSERLDDVITQASRLIISQMNTAHKVGIINCLAQIPAEQLEGRVNRVLAQRQARYDQSIHPVQYYGGRGRFEFSHALNALEMPL